MASLFRRMTAKGVKWWGDFRDAQGIRKRVPLATDKSAAQAMLNELVKRAEHRRAGLTCDFEEAVKRPLKEHLADYERSLIGKGSSNAHVVMTMQRLRTLAEGGNLALLRDLSLNKVEAFLAELRRDQGLGITSRNNYATAAKMFGNWLVKNGRLPANPLAHLSRQNTETDKRHARRAMSADELARLLAAAETGRRVEGIPGPDRAALYATAAYTGLRKGELGSLTLASLNLDDDPPTLTVAASFSKRRREDVVIVHPDLRRRLADWLATKPRLRPDEPLFPVRGRKTHKMIAKDLAAARQSWLAEATGDADRAKRDATDFLAFEDTAGRFADFHSLRHGFITGLSHAGVSPKHAQELARHSDIRLTLQTYAHVELADLRGSIESLPVIGGGPRDNRGVPSLAATGTDGAGNGAPFRVTTRVPNKCQTARATLPLCSPVCTDDKKPRHAHDTGEDGKNHRENRDSSRKSDKPLSARPAGFEPATFGFEVRDSIH